jgi:hypothetical protein
MALGLRPTPAGSPCTWASGDSGSLSAGTLSDLLLWSALEAVRYSGVSSVSTLWPRRELRPVPAVSPAVEAFTTLGVSSVSTLCP